MLAYKAWRESAARFGVSGLALLWIGLIFVVLQPGRAHANAADTSVPSSDMRCTRDSFGRCSSSSRWHWGSVVCSRSAPAGPSDHARPASEPDQTLDGPRVDRPARGRRLGPSSCVDRRLRVAVGSRKLSGWRGVAVLSALERRRHGDICDGVRALDGGVAVRLPHLPRVSPRFFCISSSLKCRPCEPFRRSTCCNS